MIKWRKYRGILLVFGIFLVSSLTVQAEEAVETLANYFKLLKTGNMESAANMWTEGAVERSSRFGITYDNIPLKVDCISPIVQDLPTMSKFLEPPVKQLTVLEDTNYVRLDYAAIVEGKLVKHSYYLYSDGDYYWLLPPQDYFARDWEQVESKYFRIHAHPSVKKYLNSAVLAEADAFVERLAEELSLEKEDKELLRQKKIEYFYCDSDQTVGDILGVRTKGGLDLASNDIISSFFPHNHEVVHLLYNIKLRHIPLATHSLLREGIAVAYGGRWGKAPTALFDLGAFLYRQKIVELDSLLTENGFRIQAGSDIAYPFAGIFTMYLLDKIGTGKYEKLYRSLSGNGAEVEAFPDSLVKRVLQEAVKASSWSALQHDFDSFVQKKLPAYAVVKAGLPSGGFQVLVDNGSFRVIADDDWVAFEFTASDAGALSGNLLFGRDDRFADGSSAMFEEQYGGKQSFEGYRFGVRFDVNEAGLYDYASNQLIAKFILGISLSDDYFDAEKNTVTVQFKRDLLNGVLPAANECKLLPL